MGIYPDNAAANAIVWLSTGLQSKGADIYDDVLACAIEIRKSLEKLKDPMFVQDLAAGVAKIQSQVAWDTAGQDMSTAKEGSLIVNNLWR